MTDDLPILLKASKIKNVASRTTRRVGRKITKAIKEGGEIVKETAKGNVFRSLGINWKILGIIAAIIFAVLAVVIMKANVLAMVLILVVVAISFVVIAAIKGKARPSFRGWIAIGLIGLFAFSFLGTGLRMSLALSLSDVQPKIIGWRFNDGVNQFYCDKSLDTFTYYTTDVGGSLIEPGNTIYSRTLIPISCKESTSSSWVMDMDGTRTGMPDIDFSLEGLYASDSGGTTINDFVFDDYPITENITLVQTFIKVVAILEFTTDEPYMELDQFFVEEYFTRFDGEFYLEYVSRSDSGEKYTTNTGGKRVVGEFAFGIETGKIRWTADEELPEAEFISTAVIGVELILQENSWARSRGVGGELDGVHPSDWGRNGEYEVGHLGRQLMYRNAWDCLQKSDSFDSVPLSEKNYQDNFVPEVYVSVPFDVLMGGVVIAKGDLADKEEVYWISRYTSKLTFLAEIVSAYDLNIAGGVTPTSTDIDFDPPDSNPLLDIWNQIVGWVIDFWKSAWYGKVVLIAVPVILISGFSFGGGKFAKKQGSVLGRASGAVTQSVTVVTGTGHKVVAQGKKALKKGTRKSKGIFKKFLKKLKFWK